jgi:hypothetical protein
MVMPDILATDLDKDANAQPSAQARPFVIPDINPGINETDETMA